MGSRRGDSSRNSLVYKAVGGIVDALDGLANGDTGINRASFRWKTTTVTAGMRTSGITAPWLLDGDMPT